MLIGARQECIAGASDIAGKLAILRRFEYDFLELALTRDEVRALDAASPGPYREAIERTGVPILSTSMGFSNFAAGSPEERAAMGAELRALLTFTAAIGADAILLATTEEGDDPLAYADVYREALLPIADEAAGLGIMLALEHVGWYKPWRLATLVRAIDHPGVRIYFDMGNCFYVGENPLEQATICAPLTGQLHIKGGPVAPLAAMPLVAVREILAAAGFAGRGCLEIDSGKDNRPLAEARGVLKMAGYW